MWPHDSHDGTEQLRESLLSPSSEFQDAVSTLNEADALNETAGEPSSSSSAASPPSSSGSTVAGAVFNFANSILGAGTIALGGAMAASGGFASIACIIVFAYLTKVSLDVVIRLSLSSGGGSYEALGQEAMGPAGRYAVIVSKLLYSFGCLVAYVVVVRDNFGPALRHVLFGTSSSTSSWLGKDGALTFILSAVVLLPLCLLRNVTPLERFSLVGVVAMAAIIVVILWLYFANPNDEVRREGTSFVHDWLQVRIGIFESLGTFVFTFVSQHTVHLAYDSLNDEIRSLSTWKYVSFYSISLSAIISIAMGLVVYVTFWDASESNMFDLYPSSPSMDMAKFLLCTTMLLTFPFPFFTCRELISLLVEDVIRHRQEDDDEADEETRRSLVQQQQQQEEQKRQQQEATMAKLQMDLFLEEFGEQGDYAMSAADLLGMCQPSLSLGASSHSARELTSPGNQNQPLPSLFKSPLWWLWCSVRRGCCCGVDCDSHRLGLESWSVPGTGGRQLKQPQHEGITVLLWALATILAIVAPSLGDILDLVGCATGTIIAFVLPALFSMQLEGYSMVSMVILLVGGVVGILGTAFSLRKLILDSV